MDGAGFGIHLALAKALPYLSSAGPQMDFLEAAYKGDLRRLRELASGKDAEGRAWLADVCVAGMGPLQAAARTGRVDVCRYMVEELGFDINAGSQIGITALSSAALDGKLDAVRYLLDHGADPNKKDEQGSVALHCAAKNGHDEVTRLLLSRGANVDIAYFHGTPLHIAAAYGKAGVMKVLLEHHADPNKVSEVLGTPLLAALHSSVELPESISLKCVKVLVEAGANVNSTFPDTPLVVATNRGFTNCIKYLLKAGANPNIPNNHCGAIPIQLAASCERKDLVELLFPLTSPIQAVSNWTVEGIMARSKSKHRKSKLPNEIVIIHLNANTEPIPDRNTCVHRIFGAYPSKIIHLFLDEQDDQNTKVQLKLQGNKAVKRKDYYGASVYYTMAIEMDPTDATLYSNRSFCHLQMTKAEEALADADTCIEMRPDWLKGYYRKGAALMSLLEYKEACDAFMVGLKLDPGNAEMEKVFREAVEGMKKDHLARKNFKPSN